MHPEQRTLVRYAVILAFSAVFCLGALIITQIPGLRERVIWRVDVARAWVGGVFDPVKPLPTSAATRLPDATAMATATLSPTPTPQVSPTTTRTPTPAPTATPLPVKHELPPPAWEKETVNNCGPSTLAHYLKYYGWKGDQRTISDVVKPKTEDKNVNVEELVYFVRNKAGWLRIEYRVGMDLNTLRAFIASGIPAMIEGGMDVDQEYWPGDDRWAGHYLLLTGYDNGVQTFTVQDSYYGANRKVSSKKIEADWETFNHVLILVFRPEQVGTVQTLLGPDWNVESNRQRALDANRGRVKEAPDNAYSWFNLGTNLVYFEKYADSAQAYDRARSLGLPQRFLRYQFGPFMAYFHSGRTDDLMTLTEYALKRTSNSEEALLWRGWGLFRLGRKAEALPLFEKALEARPGYDDALYALDFFRKN